MPKGMNLHLSLGIPHERPVPFYARRVPRNKLQRRTRFDLCGLRSSAARAGAGAALGADRRGDDSRVASVGQKRRWWAGALVECLLICALGGVDADQAV